MDKFAGNWISKANHDNHEEYMRAVACDEETIKKALQADKEKTTLNVKVVGDKATFTQSNAGNEWVTEFTLGKTFEWVSPHGTYKNTYKLEGNKLIGTHVPVKAGEATSVIERWVEGNCMHETANAGGIKTCNVFIRV